MFTETVAEAFADSATRYADRPFLHVLDETASIYDIAPGTITYAAAARGIEHLRASYAEAGYGHGHRVGLMLENRPAFFLHWLALNGLGASVVPLNSELRPAELDYLVDHSEIVLGVAATSHLPKLRASVERSGRHCASMAADAGPPCAIHVVPSLERPPDRRSECALLYTSGTTGRPKGCVLSNDYYLRAGRWYNGLSGMCALRPGEDRLITPLPLVHMNAMAVSSMAMMLSGGCIIQLDRFHPRSWWQSVRDSRATIVHYLGAMPSMLLGVSPDARERDHAVRFGFGAGVDRRRQAAFEARFGFPLLEAWAMTETGAGAAVIANREPRHVDTSCFGRPDPSVEVRIVDAAAPCPPGTPGELLVRAAGPDPRAGFFTEYLKDEQATRAAWEGDWFHTGDIVRADPEGNLHFVDRKKNVIRRSGENVSAVEVESVLRGHPDVAEVAVTAVPDETRGEEVLACIIPRVPVPAERMWEVAASIVRTALEELSYFKVPAWVAFMERLPLTASQKVSRGELKELARRLRGSPDCIDTRPLKRRRT